MSLTKKEAIEKNRIELQFSVDKETFDAAVTKVYMKQVSKINIPGFRKGKGQGSPFLYSLCVRARVCVCV